MAVGFCLSVSYVIATHHRMIPLWLVAFTVRGSVSHQQFAPVYTPVPAAVVVVVVAVATVIVISIAFTTHNIEWTHKLTSHKIYILTKQLLFYLPLTPHSWVRLFLESLNIFSTYYYNYYRQAIVSLFDITKQYTSHSYCVLGNTYTDTETLQPTLCSGVFAIVHSSVESNTNKEGKAKKRRRHLILTTLQFTCDGYILVVYTCHLNFKSNVNFGITPHV